MADNLDQSLTCTVFTLVYTYKAYCIYYTPMCGACMYVHTGHGGQSCHAI